MVAWLLPAIGSAFINKAVNGQQQQPTYQIPQMGRQQIQPMRQPFILRGMPDVSGLQLPQDPIMAAMAAYGNQPNQPNQPKPQDPSQQPPSAWGKAKDQFMSALTQSLVQRLIFGSGSGGQSYAPPTFR